jgi:hypothetical protein
MRLARHGDRVYNLLKTSTRKNVGVDDDNDRELSTPEGDGDTLPVGEVATAPEKEIIATPSTANSRSGLAPPTEGHKQPLEVRVIRDERPSVFEKRTVAIGWAGFGIAVLSLIAACIAGYYVYGQFIQMKQQTKILSDTLAKAKEDSVQANRDTQRQLHFAKAITFAHPGTGAEIVTPVISEKTFSEKCRSAQSSGKVFFRFDPSALMAVSKSSGSWKFGSNGSPVAIHRLKDIY